VEKWLEVLVVLAAVFIVLQVCVMAGMFVSIRKLSFNIERMRTDLENSVRPALTDFREVLGQTKHILQSFHSTAENIASISETVKFQVERVNGVIEETTDRARIQISRADQVVAEAIQKMEATATVVQENVLAPIREASAIIRGVHGGLHFLFARKKNAVDQVHQDEELFI